MHYEQIKRGFAPIRDFGLKNGAKAFSFIEPKNKMQNNNEKDALKMRQEDREYVQANLS